MIGGASPTAADPPAPGARVSAPVPATAPEGDTARTRLSAALATRLGVGLVLLGGSILVVGGTPASSDALFRLVLAVFATSLGFLFWLALRPAHAERIAYTLVTIDLLLTTYLVSLTGGAVSGFSSLYGVVVLGASVVVGPRPTLVAAGLAPILYVSIALGLASGVVAAPADSLFADSHPSNVEFSLALLRNIVGLMLVGGLAAALSDRLHRTKGALVRATESAAVNARLTEDVVRSLGSGLLTTNLDDVVQTINAAGARMLGRPVSAIVGAPLDTLLDGVSRKPESRSEGLARRTDGTTFPVGYSRTPLVAHDGQILGSLLLFQDLTELATLREKAERAERLAVLGQLAAGLAHEIRNPLGAISGSVELVRDAEALGSEDKKLLETVLGEVDRVNELVTTMLELGRPTAPERRQVDVAGVARDVVDLARRQPSPTTVQIVLDALPAQAHADPAQLRQVVWNLVKNAIQFSPKDGEVRVVARTDGDDAVIEVIDHGRGVDPADLDRVFDPFFTKRKHGVGLGLAIAKQIIDAHGGSIGVSSAPGETRFVVRLATGTAPRGSDQLDA